MISLVLKPVQHEQAFVKPWSLLEKIRFSVPFNDSRTQCDINSKWQSTRIVTKYQSILDKKNAGQAAFRRKNYGLDFSRKIGEDEIY